MPHLRHDDAFPSQCNVENARAQQRIACRVGLLPSGAPHARGQLARSACECTAELACRTRAAQHGTHHAPWQSEACSRAAHRRPRPLAGAPDSINTVIASSPAPSVLVLRSTAACGTRAMRLTDVQSDAPCTAISTYTPPCAPATAAPSASCVSSTCTIREPAGRPSEPSLPARARTCCMQHYARGAAPHLRSEAWPPSPPLRQPPSSLPHGAARRHRRCGSRRWQARARAQRQRAGGPRRWSAPPAHADTVSLHGQRALLRYPARTCRRSSVAVAADSACLLLSTAATSSRSSTPLFCTCCESADISEHSA